MNRRMIASLSVAVLILLAVPVVAVSLPQIMRDWNAEGSVAALDADDDPPLEGQTYRGPLVSVVKNKITILGTEMHTFRVANEATITLNGETASLEDLRKGDKITLVAERTKHDFVTSVIKAQR